MQKSSPQWRIHKFLMARGGGAAGAGVGSPSALSNSYRHVFAIRH